MTGRRWRNSFAAGTVALLIAAAAGAQPGECGDCDGDGEVEINELITAVRISLNLAPLSECAAADVDGTGSVAVTDLIRAVGRAITGSCGGSSTPTPTPVAAEAAGAGSAVDSGDFLEQVVQVFDFGLVGETSNAGTAAAHRLVRRGALRALIGGDEGGTVAGSMMGGYQDCPEGGFAELTCIPEEFGSRFEGLFLNCGIVDEATGNLVTYSGDVTLVLDDPQFCSSMETGVARDQDLRSLEIMFTVRNPAGELLLDFVGRDLHQVLQTDDAGCAGPQGSFDNLQGQVVVSCRGSVSLFGAVFDCGEEGFDFRHIYNNLLLNRESNDGGRGCQDVISARGSVESPTEQLAVEYRGFTLTQIKLPEGGSTSTEDGEQRLACLGNTLRYRTTAEIQTEPGASCPSGGALEVEVVEASSTFTIAFAPGGAIQIDRDGDGTPEDVFADCRDSKLGQCFAMLPTPSPLPTPAGQLCAPCQRPDQCSATLRLGCFQCSFECSGDVRRCVPADVFVECEDGIF